MMLIDPKNPYAKPPKKIDNELGIYNADYENFMHFVEQSIGECEHIEEYRGLIARFLEEYNSVCYISEEVKIDEYCPEVTAYLLYNHVSWMWNEFWSKYN